MADAQALAADEQRSHPDWHRLWPTWTQEHVAGHWEDQVRRRAAAVDRFHPAHRGDELIWSPWLVHRGSVPLDPARERRAVIAHFSGARHRPEMPDRAEHPGGGLYAVFPPVGPT